MPRSYVTGQRTRPVTTLATGRVGIIIACVYPWGLSSLLPESASYPDGYVDLTDLCGGSRVARLEQQLVEGKPRSRIRAVEEFLLGLRRRTPDPALIAKATQLLSGSIGDQQVQTTAEELGVSRRHLQRVFNSQVGLSPKMYARVMRFQRALRIRRRSQMSWAQVAAECGFSDQSHLVREVGEFAGRTPNQIQPSESLVDRVFNGDRRNALFDSVYL